MTENVKMSQQETDRHTQDDLTRSVGARLSPREKSANSWWSAVRRLLRLG